MRPDAGGCVQMPRLVPGALPGAVLAKAVPITAAVGGILSILAGVGLHAGGGAAHPWSDGNKRNNKRLQPARAIHSTNCIHIWKHIADSMRVGLPPTSSKFLAVDLDLWLVSCGRE